MGNLTVQKQGPEVQLDRELDYSERAGRNVVEMDPWRARPGVRSPEILAAGLVGGGAWLGVLLFLLAIRAVFCWEGCWSGEAHLVNAVFLFWVVLPALGALGAGVLWAWAHLARVRAETLRQSITRDRYGNPIGAGAVLRKTDAQLLRELMLASQVDIATAQHKLYRGVDSLSIGNTANNAAQLAAALPEPAPEVVIEHIDDWMRWLDERPHLMLAAETGGGKSVLAGVLLAQRARQRGDTIAILDPHWSPRVKADEGRLVAKWGGIAPAAMTYYEIREALLNLRAEYDHRIDQLQRGEIIEGEFPPLTVVIDEAHEVVKALKVLDKAAEKRSAVSTWGLTAEVLGSGARKVNINVILLTVSPLVEDIEMNSAMRKNFFRIALAAEECRRIISEDSDKPRREALLEALRGRSFPAAVERKGEVFLLNREGLLDRLPERIEARSWARLSSERLHDQAETLETRPNATDRQTDGPKPINIGLLLRFLRKKGYTRDQARKELDKRGLAFDNKLWTEAGR